MQTETRPHRLVNFFCWFMMVFLVLFPKGGIKVGVIPLTWGYVFMALTAVPLLLVRTLTMPLIFKPRQLVALLGPLPFLLIYIYTYVFEGVTNSAFAFSTFVGIFLLPWIFLFIYPPFLPRVDGRKLANYLRYCILIAAVWGIFLFVLHPFYGSYIEIPFLTVNLGDYGHLEQTKHIARGFFFKLISTYNNGNLYGICTLMLLPLYDHFEKALWRRGIVKIALLLTLSRTVWLGLVFNEMIPLIVQLFKQIKTFPILRLGKAAKSLLAVCVMFGFVLLSLLFNNSSLSFLFDPTAGGRTEKLEAIQQVSFLPPQGLYGFEEALYVSAVAYFGISGLITFLYFMFTPFLVLFFDRSALQSPTRRAALKGLVVYLVVAASDGAPGYIPTMAFYWFVFMIFLFGWPEARSGLPAFRERFALAAAPVGARP